ncbi:MAG: hypothetical protein E7662_11915 [Ruminococcaceae bacterium]|nr:hypothetical protein [Oscillospiraceae bacterium]
MKKLTTLLLAAILCLALAAPAFAAGTDAIGRSDDMEGYALNQTFLGNQTPVHNYNNFGAGNNEGPVITDKIAHSGKYSLRMSDFFKSDASLKVNNLFTRTLSDADVGRTFRISFWIYVDKADGAYKKVGAIDTRVAYTKDELAKSESTVFGVMMTGPDGQQYQYRHGADYILGAQYLNNYFTVKWNEWTQISFDYTVKADYLDNFGTEKGSNKMVNGFKLMQWKADGSLNQAFVNTYYIDDLTVVNVATIPAETTAPETKAPETTTASVVPVAPATFDAAVIPSVIAAAAASGIVVIRRKRK